MEDLTVKKQRELSDLLEELIDDKSLIGMIMSAVNSTRDGKYELKKTQLAVSLKKSKIQQKEHHQAILNCHIDGYCDVIGPTGKKCNKAMTRVYDGVNCCLNCVYLYHQDRTRVAKHLNTLRK